MTECKKADIAVVGTGPAGFVAAMQMAKLGFSTVLIGPEPSVHDGRTTALLGSSVSYLEKLGLWEAISKEGQALRVMRLIDDTGRLFRAPTTEFNSAEIGLDAFGSNIDNASLLRILRDVAQGMEDGLLIREPRLAKSVSLVEGAVRIETEDGSLWQSRLVIAADGVNSLVRETVGIDMRKWAYPQTALVVNLHHASVSHNNASTEFHTRTGPFTLVPFKDGYCSSLVCVVTDEEAKRLKAMDREVLARALEDRAHSIYGAFEVISEAQTYPLSGMVARRFSGPRVALIAQSAHIFPPIGAQGLNLSLRDIASLAEVLEDSDGKDPGSVGVLDQYERERRSDVWSRTAGVHMLNMSLISSLPFGQGARMAGLALANMVPQLRRAMMRAGLDAPGKVTWLERD
ncbi:FAD-dependent monooxygenase [uncultured Cohaesibacter sp.]|uniref:FAD-dependent monooxygenase n=1 Tax=uncultured Cohaesibacter sp. TaxID=1002546 RepID=UPI002930173D|nr:FAD-dependent monooxygenase [uncultured Cohaesibacter sp.]